ncbi:MAG: 5-oxoprolinase subunit PxpB, partial [Nitrospirales bacterium]
MNRDTTARTQLDRYPRVLPVGDCGVMVEFGNQITPQVNDRVMAFARAVTDLRLSGFREVVPTYCAATVYFDPGVDKAQTSLTRLGELARRLPARSVRGLAVVQIPVLYGGVYGPDLDTVARLTDLSPNRVVALHQSVEYRVYMLGFSPGFPYLGRLPEAIAVPRLGEPRACVPAGSVGLAGFQTGIYPQDSPGGWRVIGRTPLRLYDPGRAAAFWLEPGDRVRFVRIDEGEYKRLAMKNENVKIKSVR